MVRPIPHPMFEAVDVASMTVEAIIAQAEYREAYNSTSSLSTPPTPIQ